MWRVRTAAGEGEIAALAPCILGPGCRGGGPRLGTLCLTGKETRPRQSASPAELRVEKCYSELVCKGGEQFDE